MNFLRIFYVSKSQLAVMKALCCIRSKMYVCLVAWLGIEMLGVQIPDG